MPDLPDLIERCLETETLVLFVQGQADAAVWARIEEHASRCDACREVLSSLGRSGLGSVERPAAVAEPRSGVERALDPGTLVGRYVIVRKIGAGGMGVVYAAHDPELGRVVAVNLLRPGGEPSMQARLRREAQAMAQLAHPNVVAVHDVGAVGDQIFVAMERIEGDTVARWLLTPRAGREILEVFCAAGRGLAAAHAAGIVHRDFKPENVLIGADGRVRVGDFGLARAVEPGAPVLDAVTDVGPGPESGSVSPDATTAQPGLTAAGTVIGTPYYLAPELYDGARADARSDQFSFCVALFAALYGERPFEGATLQALAANVRAGLVREPAARSGVPRRVRAAIRRGLAVDPALRFGSLEELVHELAPPPHRLPRSALAIGAALVAALVLVVWRAARAPAELPDQRCTGAAAAFAPAWNPARRSALEAAFTATRMPYAGVAIDQVTGTLDQYAARWARAHTEVCRATQILGEQSETTLDLRMACLDRRRQAVDALVGSLASADAAAVARSVEAAVQLADVATCADVAALRQIVAPPVDSATRDQIAMLRQRLAAARARFELGAFAPALALVRPIVAEAHTLAYRPFEAEAEFLQGLVEDAVGDSAHAEATLEAAVWSAEAGRHDEIAARGWSWLVFLVGYGKAEPARGLELARRATAAIERLGGNSEIESTLERALGAIDAGQDKLDSGIAHFENAVALAERALGPEHPAVVRGLGNLGQAVMARGDVTRAVAIQERVLGIEERRLGPDHPDVALALHNLGNAHTDAGNNVLAEHELRRALAIRSATLGPEHPDVATTLSDLARVLNRQGRAEDALALDLRAVEIGRKAFGPEHPTLAGQLVDLGIHLGAVGRPAEGDARLAEAQAIFTRLYGADHVEVLGVAVARADLLIGQARWTEAAAAYVRLIPPLEKAQGGGEALISAQANLGRAYVELHQPARALALLEPLSPRMDKLTPLHRGEIEQTLARALWDTGAARRAHALASRARADFTAAGPGHRRELDQVDRWLASHALPRAP